MIDYISKIIKHPRQTIIVNTRNLDRGHVSLLAFTMKGDAKKNADKIAGKLKKNKNVKKIETFGGYVNIWFKDSFFLDYLKSKPKKKHKTKNIIIEYPSANPNKPLHIGHLRNLVLGDTISNIYAFDGYNVIRMNYINDMGLQVAEILWDYMKNPPNKKVKLDDYLGKRYVTISKKMTDPGIKKQVEHILKQLEIGNNKTSEIGRSMAEQCAVEHHKTMFRLNVYHDYDIFESDVIHCMAKQGMEKIRANANVYIAKKENKGCYVVKLDTEQFPNLLNNEKILMRSNGTLTYTGKDVLFHLWKFNFVKIKLYISEWIKQPNNVKLKVSNTTGKLRMPKADKIINIIGMEQEHEQKIVKYILSKITGDNKINEKYVHMSYGLVNLAGGERFSGRKGTWVGYSADDVLDKGIKKAENILKQRNINNTKTANAMAVSAVRFAMLKYAIHKNIDFDWDSALTFEGDSAPYVQYAYVRCMGILRKAKKIKTQALPKSYKLKDEETLILNKLIDFENVIITSARMLKPNDIITYMLELVPAFNRFYDKCRIIDEGKINPVRLKIVERTIETLGTAMDLCGIIKLNKM